MLSVIVLALVALLSLASMKNIFSAACVFFFFAAAQYIINAAPLWQPELLWPGVVSALLGAAALYASVRCGVFSKPPEVELKLWRVLARPFALLFIPIDLTIGSRATLTLIGIVAMVFIITDLIRIFSTLHSDRIYKRGERRKFSSMTAFMVSLFAVFLIFSPPITYLSLGFLTIGDLSSKLIGIRFGKIRIFEHRTLEGTLAFLMGSLIAGYIIYLFIPYPAAYLFVGSICATAIELFSKDIDDNLTVGIFSAVILSVMQFFFQI